MRGLERPPPPLQPLPLRGPCHNYLLKPFGELFILQGNPIYYHNYVKAGVVLVSDLMRHKA